MQSLLALLLALPLPAAPVHSSFSTDFSSLARSLRHMGIGLGIRYEHSLLPHLSATGGFSHTIGKASDEDIWMITVGIEMGARYYPFHKDQQGFFLGTAFGLNFLEYVGNDAPGKSDAEDNGGEVYQLALQTGYRWELTKKQGMELSLGYIHLFNPIGLVIGNPKEHLADGLQVSVSFKRLF
ncbi:MAG: DUF3575 domain-containing protein [Sphaerochaetaceae bacterium]|jgi:hypothetical protein|nr:DUF3575 domain-containing protein [Sphaerochaetaceae bacterium]